MAGSEVALAGREVLALLRNLMSAHSERFGILEFGFVFSFVDALIIEEQFKGRVHYG